MFLHLRSLRYETDMAFAAHLSTQTPHLAHMESSILCGAFLSPEIALCGHAMAQAPQPVQISASME
jgi:hypothetical protein